MTWNQAVPLALVIRILGIIISDTTFEVKWTQTWIKRNIKYLLASIQVYAKDGSLYKDGDKFLVQVHISVPLVVPQEGYSVVVALRSLLPDGDDGNAAIAVEVHRFYFPHDLAGHAERECWRFLEKETY